MVDLRSPSPSMVPTQQVSPMSAACSQETLEYKRTEDFPIAVPKQQTTPTTATLEPAKAAEPVPTPTPVTPEPKELTQHMPTRTAVSNETTQVGNNLGGGDTQNAAPADASKPVHGGDKALPLHPPNMDKAVAPVADASQPVHGGDKALPLHPDNMDKSVAPVADASKLAHGENKTPPPAPHLAPNLTYHR